MGKGLSGVGSLALTQCSTPPLTTLGLARRLGASCEAERALHYSSITMFLRTVWELAILWRESPRLPRLALIPLVTTSSTSVTMTSVLAAERQASRHLPFLITSSPIAIALPQTDTLQTRRQWWITFISLTIRRIPESFRYQDRRAVVTSLWT